MVTDEREQLHQEIARAIDVVLDAISRPSGPVTPNRLAEAVMSVLDRVVAERDEARQHVEMHMDHRLQIEAMLDEIIGTEPIDDVDGFVASVAFAIRKLQDERDGAQREAKRLDHGWAGANLTASNLRARVADLERRLSSIQAAITEYGPLVREQKSKALLGILDKATKGTWDHRYLGSAGARGSRRIDTDPEYRAHATHNAPQDGCPYCPTDEDMSDSQLPVDTVRDGIPTADDAAIAEAMQRRIWRDCCGEPNQNDVPVRCRRDLNHPSPHIGFREWSRVTPITWSGHGNATSAQRTDHKCFDTMRPIGRPAVHDGGTD